MRIEMVLVHDKRGEQKWTPVFGRRRKRVRFNEVHLQRLPAHCHPSQPSDTETTSSDSDDPLTISFRVKGPGVFHCAVAGGKISLLRVTIFNCNRFTVRLRACSSDPRVCF